MTSTTIAARILLALGAANYMVACGSDESTSSSGATASSTRAATSSASASVGVGGMGGAGGLGAGGMAGMGHGGLGEGGLPCPRRPFLVASLPRAGSIVERDDWSRKFPDADIDPATRAALAAAWLEDARQEHASVAAFGRFTMLLAAVGAPPELILASQRAGMDEVAHARACFALAARYAGVAHGPGEVCLDGALDGTVTLADVAALAVHEGCVGETLGVLLASHQLEGATDPAVRTVLERLVRDEMRHAELAWRFAKWAIERGGDSVRATVTRALAVARAETLALRYPEEGDINAVAWRAHGRLTSDQIRFYVERGLDTLIAPCARALVAITKSESYHDEIDFARMDV